MAKRGTRTSFVLQQCSHDLIGVRIGLRDAEVFLNELNDISCNDHFPESNTFHHSFRPQLGGAAGIDIEVSIELLVEAKDVRELVHLNNLPSTVI